jgi:phosphate transport system permease protein
VSAENVAIAAPPAEQPPPAARPRRRTSLFARGEPLVWLTGGALVLCLLMIAGLILIVFANGLTTFWPQPIVRITTPEGEVLLGEVTRQEDWRPAESSLSSLPEATLARARAHLERSAGASTRRLVRTGNFELTGVHFKWVSDFEVVEEERPEWAVLLERTSWGRFYGMPVGFKIDGELVATEPAEVWERFEEHHPRVRTLVHEVRELEDDEIGAVNREREEARLHAQRALLDHGKDSPQHRAAVEEAERADQKAMAAEAEITARADEKKREMARYVLVLKTSDGREKEQELGEIVRAYTANRLGTFDKIGVYFSRWWEYLTDEPREANSEGGVFPAIFGTVVMTLLMSILVVPFGVLAALYLREYAKQGPIVSSVRIAINNLAGVPSIVYGVFGLGFFCYIIGGGLDGLFFSANLPNPTFGKGGVLWASLTLALLTLPVVIVATEEALSAVPGSMREGSYACGASKWQTMRRIVLPRAMPGIMTGMILAMARGAGEVAPLMLVGAVKSAPQLPSTGCSRSCT